MERIDVLMRRCELAFSHSSEERKRMVFEEFAPVVAQTYISIITGDKRERSQQELDEFTRFIFKQRELETMSPHLFENLSQAVLKRLVTLQPRTTPTV